MGTTYTRNTLLHTRGKVQPERHRKSNSRDHCHLTGQYRGAAQNKCFFVTLARAHRKGLPKRGDGGPSVTKFGMGGRVGLGGRRPDPCLLVPNASRQEAEANLVFQVLQIPSVFS